MSTSPITPFTSLRGARTPRTSVFLKVLGLSLLFGVTNMVIYKVVATPSPTQSFDGMCPCPSTDAGQLDADAESLDADGGQE